jgi:hypothetical protein
MYAWRWEKRKVRMVQGGYFHSGIVGMGWVSTPHNSSFVDEDFDLSLRWYCKL